MGSRPPQLSPPSSFASQRCSVVLSTYLEPTALLPSVVDGPIRSEQGIHLSETGLSLKETSVVEHQS